MKNLKVAFSILSIVLVTGCSVDKKSEPSIPKVDISAADVHFKQSGLSLASQWVLESFNNKNFIISTKSSYITINNDLKIYEGDGGCNSVSGEVVVKDDTIKFGKATMTKMACDNLEQESLFIQSLNKATKYKIVGGELFLYEDDNLLMTLESFRR